MTNSVETAELAIRHRDNGVVGFDLAGEEDGFPPKKHVEAFQAIERANFYITIHAGEAYGPKSIWQALQYCGTHRLGHATRLREDIEILPDNKTIRCARLPLTHYRVHFEDKPGTCEVRDDGAPTLDLSDLRAYWAKQSTIGQWPIADLHFGLVDRFLRRVIFTDPEALQRMRGRPVLYLCNHQVGVESILFNLVAGALLEAPLMTIAKSEHRESWIGQLIELAAAYPSNAAPNPILFFDRNNPQALFALMREFRTALASSPSSLMIHTEGTRALSCRTPVAHLSSVFIDLALELDLPIIPVRFAGGLPVVPAVWYQSGRAGPCGSRTADASRARRDRGEGFVDDGDRRVADPAGGDVRLIIRTVIRCRRATLARS